MIGSMLVQSAHLLNTSMNYLYQITNLINNKIYVGVHKTNDIDDGYMGSGTVIVSAIQKHGIAHFRKDILEFFDTYEAALAKEAEIVTDEFLLREDVYNLRRGGFGGFDYINSQNLNNAAGNGRLGGIATYAKIKSDPELNASFKERSSKRLRQLHADGLLSYNNFAGRLHGADSKEKMSLAKTGKGVTVDNSQFGTMWVTDGCNNKKIKKDDPIPEGWKKGRILRD